MIVFRLIFFAIIFSLHACILVEDYDPAPNYVYYDMCYVEDPYYTAPEYCYDLNYQAGYCCAWHVGYSCYEDWCIWDDMCNWEYISYECGY
jgi:hypothetical protein